MDAKRHLNAYAWIYYGVKALCLFLARLNLAADALFFPSSIEVAASLGHGGFIGAMVMVFTFGFLALFLAAGVFAAVQLLRRLREMSRRSTWIMSLVLAIAAWMILGAVPRNLVLGLTPHAPDRFFTLEGLRILATVVAGWAVYVLSASVLSVIARRAPRQSLEATPSG